MVLTGAYILYNFYISYTAIPELELLGSSEENIEVFSEYVDPGFVASVQEKPPVNDVVVDGLVDTQQLGQYKITYIVKNNKGKNEVKKERLVTVEDKVAPEITLNKGDVIAITKGSSYTDAGATAIDNVDGDISANIEIIGEVNTQKTGEYEITYRIQDSSGNQSEVKRKITVTSAPSGTTIYLTFDDGPSKLTSGILDTLKAYDAKATFFVIGSQLDKYADVVKRAQDEGHTIALHSNTHSYEKIYTSDEAFWKDMDKLSSRVTAITGKESKLIRFPGGTSNTISKNYSNGIMTRLVKQAHDRGYKIYDWSISSGDASGDGVAASKISNNVIKGMKRNDPPAIVLTHDAPAKSTTAEALKEILKWGNDNGYTFAAMDESTPELIHGINN